MDPAEERPGSSDFQDRGSTAFEWRERLAYSDADRIATMEGDVVIHHVPDPGTKGREFWMWTQRIEAELESKATDADALAATQPTPATSPATSPTTLASTQPAPDAFESVALKRLIAEGDVRVEADHRAAPDAPPEKMQLNARAIEYDAATGILTASGTEDRPVRIGGSATIREGAVQELRWNTRTDQIEVTKGRVR